LLGYLSKKFLVGFRVKKDRVSKFFFGLGLGPFFFFLPLLPPAAAAFAMASFVFFGGATMVVLGRFEKEPLQRLQRPEETRARKKKMG